MSPRATPTHHHTHASRLSLSVFCFSAACSGASDDGDTVEIATAGGDLAPNGFPPLMLDLSLGSTVTVKVPESPMMTFVRNGGRLDLPCNATSVTVTYTYTNSGPWTAGAHANRATFGGVGGGSYSKSQAPLGSLLIRTDSFTHALDAVRKDTPFPVTIRVDDPSAINESDEDDNLFKINLQRACIF